VFFPSYRKKKHPSTRLSVWATTPESKQNEKLTADAKSEGDALIQAATVSVATMHSNEEHAKANISASIARERERLSSAVDQAKFDVSVQVQKLRAAMKAVRRADLNIVRIKQKIARAIKTACCGKRDACDCG